MPVRPRTILLAALAALLFLCLIAIPASAATGSIRVFSDPTEAYVCIDNFYCGYTTEQFDSLSADTYHTVTVSMGGYQTYTESVLVTSGSTYVVNANLQPVPVSTGSIEVHSTPYATACIDGGNCQPTTATFDGLAGNSYHQLTISQSGYQSYYDTVWVTARQTAVVDAVLQPSQPATGSVQVFITPGGGTICIDGGQCQAGVGTASGTGSYQFSGVTANGYHTITVTENGYQRFITELYVQPDQLNEVTAALQPLASPTGNVQVYVTPGGGTVCLDGARCDANVGSSDGTGSTQFTSVLANTQHTVTVIATGYQPYSAQVTVQPGQTGELDITLQPAAPQTILPTPQPTPPATPLPTAPAPQPTRSGLDALPVLGALALCGAVFLLRKDRN